MKATRKQANSKRNLNCLANALYPLIQDTDLVTESLSAYQKKYELSYLEKLSKKLGLDIITIKDDPDFLSQLFDLLYVSSDSVVTNVSNDSPFCKRVCTAKAC